MNKNIKELAKLADPGYTGNSEDGLGASLVGNDAIEKFAELIIWECITVCKSRVGIPDYNTGRMHCASDIRDYFGVE